MSKVWAGIGSRLAPMAICTLMTQIARELASQGYWLRTGGAQGADQAFAYGCPQKTIWYLPWASYEAENRSIIMRGYGDPVIGCTEPHIMAIAEAHIYHPNPSSWTPGVTKLMGRNMHIITGQRLNAPVNFVIYWAEEDKFGIKGGTRQAVEYAKVLFIPTYNLFSYPDTTAKDMIELIMFPKENMTNANH